MNIYELTNPEILLHLGQSFKKWRLSPSGAGLSQMQLAEESGISITSIKRFEKTGNITLGSLIALLRAAHLLESLGTLIPSLETEPSPLEILAQERQKKPLRQRAIRSDKKS